MSDTLATPPPYTPPTDAAARDVAVAAPHRAPGRWAIAAVLVGAAVTDLAMWTTGPGLAWTIAASAVALAVAVAVRPTNRASWLLLAAVPCFAVWCSIRTSPWLIAPDIVAVNLCLLLGGALAHGGRWSDQSLPRLLLRLGLFAEDLVFAASWLGRARRRNPTAGRTPPRDRTAIMTGLAIAIPLVIVLAILLASADAVFASFFDVGLDTGAIVRHVVFLGGGAWATAALLRRGSRTTEPAIEPATGVSATVGNVVLGAVAATFTLYAASRLLALTSMAERIADTRGLTWAEYARTGFFQLLAVAAITLVVLVSVLGWCDEGTQQQARTRRRLGLLTVILVIGIVVDAVHRLSGYEAAYGLTMLRLYSTGFAIWLGAVFVLGGIALIGGYRGRRWLAPAVIATALAGLLALNIANPEAIVARRNLNGPTRAGETDARYLITELGPDAAPELDPALERVIAGAPEPVRAYLLGAYCDRIDRDGGFLNPNLARRNAEELRTRRCG